MDVKTEQRGQVVVVSVVGSLDALTAPELGEALQGQIRAGQTNLVADLAGVDYTSSAGLRVLLGAVKDTRAGGGDLRLAAVQADVNKVLKLAGFTSIVKLFPEVEQAVASFSA